VQFGVLRLPRGAPWTAPSPASPGCAERKVELHLATLLGKSYCKNSAHLVARL
jgi:hypothetical protein